MVKVLDHSLPGIARLLLETLGTDATLLLAPDPDPAFDPVSMTTTPPDPVSFACQVAVEDVRGFQEREDGALTVGRVRKVTLAAEGLPRPLESRDTLLLDGNEHELAGLSPIYSGDLVAVYQAEIRR